MFTSKIYRLLAISAALCISFTPYTQAQDGIVKEQQGDSATYVNGGIGDAQIRYMQSIAKNWPMRIMFSQLKANEFVAGVNLQITDSKNFKFLQLEDAGPLTYVELPAGTYNVTATYMGQPQTRKLTVSKNGKRDLHFHWKGIVESDPFDGKPLGGVQVPG
jgi:hypothetical protein